MSQEILVVKRRPIELHCVHNGGPVIVDADRVNEVREMNTPQLGNWTRCRMQGSSDVEVREPYKEVAKLVYGEQE